MHKRKRNTDSSRGCKKVKTDRMYECKSKLIIKVPTFKVSKIFENQQIFTHKWHHTATYYPNRDQIFAFGGVFNNMFNESFDETMNQNFNDLFTIDLKKQEITIPKFRGTLPMESAGQTSVLYKDSILFYGGSCGDFDFEIGTERDVMNGIHEYYIPTNTWKKVKFSNDTPQLKDHTANLYGDEMIIFGGLDKQIKEESNMIYKYDIQQNEWSIIADSGDIPEPRQKHHSVIYKDKLFVFGGVSKGKILNDLHVFHFKTFKWEKIKVSGEIPSPREGSCAAILGECLYIFGGREEGKKNTNTMYELNLNTFVWRHVPISGDIPSRHLHSCIVRGSNEIIIFGGYVEDMDSKFGDFYSLKIEERLFDTKNIKK